MRGRKSVEAIDKGRKHGSPSRSRSRGTTDGNGQGFLPGSSRGRERLKRPKTGVIYQLPYPLINGGNLRWIITSEGGFLKKKKGGSIVNNQRGLMYWRERGSEGDAYE